MARRSILQFVSRCSSIRGHISPMRDFWRLDEHDLPTSGGACILVALRGGDLGGPRIRGEGGQVAQASALEAPADEIEPHAVTYDGPELRVVSLDEQHAVAVVRVGPELKGFGQQAIKSFSEVDSVSRQEDTANFQPPHQNLWVEKWGSGSAPSW